LFTGIIATAALVIGLWSFYVRLHNYQEHQQRHYFKSEQKEAIENHEETDRLIIAYMIQHILHKFKVIS